MKKIAILFVVIALLLLSGCRKSNELFDISYEATYSENLKFVTEKEKYSIEDTTICFTITNVSSQ
jgi:major membrane immunogen (membrane-anchored lipoprotein)